MLAYQVWECTSRTAPRPAAISTSVPQRLQRRVGRGQRGRGRVGVHVGSSRGRAEAVHVDVDELVAARGPGTRRAPRRRRRPRAGTPGSAFRRAWPDRMRRCRGERSATTRGRRPCGTALGSEAWPLSRGSSASSSPAARASGSGPLTADRAKPAVPFGGNYRLVDFVLSNLVNAGYLRICVLTQYKSHSLDRHITKTWRMSTLLGNYVTPVPAQQRLGPRWYTGSADAIHQWLNLVYDEQPDYIVVFGADHVYRMDPRQMVAQHIESGAGRTVAGIRVPRSRGAPASASSTPTPTAQVNGVPREAGGPARAARRPGRDVRLDGQLRLHDRGAARGAARADAGDEGSVHDMGGNIIPTHGRQGRRVRLRLRRQRRARGRPTATAATGATSGRSTPTTTRTWTSCRCTRSSTSTTGSGRSLQPAAAAAGEVRRGRPRPGVDGRLGRHRRPARRCGTRSSRPVRRRRRRLRRGFGAHATASRSGAGPSCATRSSTRTSSCPPGAHIGVDLELDRQRYHVTDVRRRRARQGRDRRRSERARKRSVDRSGRRPVTGRCGPGSRFCAVHRGAMLEPTGKVRWPCGVAVRMSVFAVPDRRSPWR